MTYGTETYGTITYGTAVSDDEEPGGFGDGAFGTGPFGDGESDTISDSTNKFGSGGFGDGPFGTPTTGDVESGYASRPFGDGPFGGEQTLSTQQTQETLPETAYYGGGKYGQGLYAFENEQMQTIRDEWTSGGIELHPENDVWNLESAISTPLALVSDDITEINAAHHIDTAVAGELDRLGELANVQRQTDESDARFRARIKATFQAAITGTTHEDVLEFIATLLETRPNRVQIDWLPSVSGTARVSVFEEDIEAASITTTDLETFATQIVPAGHKIIVELRGTFQFDDDNVTIPSDHGFSDDDFAGGTLSELL